MLNAVSNLLFFSKVKDQKSFWNWLKEEPINILYETRWYNNQTFKEMNSFNSDRKFFLVGMPRLRQLRVKGTTFEMEYRV